MNHEHEQHRAGSPAAATTHNDPAEPGQSSRSAQLRKPEHPVASGLVQREADAAGAMEPSAIQAAAARGVATASSQLPYLDTIQPAFGRHDISGVQAHTGPEAAASARAMGAKAYATGNHVVLGSGTDLRTVAHEAAHVVQQRHGVQLKRGVGQVGDHYERHADEVADRVVRGESVEESLDRDRDGAVQPSVVQCVRGQEVPGGDAAVAEGDQDIDLSNCRPLKKGPPPTYEFNNCYYKVFTTQKNAQDMADVWREAAAKIRTPDFGVCKVRIDSWKKPPWAFWSKKAEGKFFQVAKSGGAKPLCDWVEAQTDIRELHQAQSALDWARNNLGDAQGFVDVGVGFDSIRFIDINIKKGASSPGLEDVLVVIAERIEKLNGTTASSSANPAPAAT